MLARAFLARSRRDHAAALAGLLEGAGKGTSLVLRWLCITLHYILTFCVTTYGLYCRVRTLSDSRMYLRYTRALRPPPAGGLRERAK